MKRPGAVAVLQRFLARASIGELAFWLCGVDRPHDYIEQCIRRGLRGEVRIGERRGGRGKRGRR